MHIVLFHFYEVQEQAKLIDDGRNQNSGWGHKGTLWTAKNALYLD